MEKPMKIESFWLYFTYGVKLQIKHDSDYKDCIMMLNFSNNFFLDFISPKKNMKILN